MIVIKAHDQFRLEESNTDNSTVMITDNSTVMISVLVVNLLIDCSSFAPL